MQTELLLQGNDHGEEDLRKLLQIEKATSRLSRLNQTLLLLTRIDNEQFGEPVAVPFEVIIQNKLDAFAPMIEAKGIQLSHSLQPTVWHAHPELADILINNLLSNAIHHNLPGGSLSVALSAGLLVVRNTGKPLAVDPAQLFVRFQKSDAASNSVGLGLAIVKEICELYGWQIQYETEGETHQVSITFIHKSHSS
ncbi:MAG: HAMP domain-containing histidine kinase [Bacteroidia bacterium]|nr:HAMP domain-containing histidine kinase [Bacteroidia bacterium]